MKKILYSFLLSFFFIFLFTSNAHAASNWPTENGGWVSDKKCTNPETENPTACILTGTGNENYMCCEGYTCVLKENCVNENPTVPLCGKCVENDKVPEPEKPGLAPSISCIDNGQSGCEKDEDCCDNPPDLRCVVNGTAHSLDDALKNSMCTNGDDNLYVDIEDAKDYFETLLSPAQPAPCLEKNEDGTCKSVATSIGMPLGTDIQSFTESIFKVVLGISGGIALILIVISGYRIIFSKGNPEKLQGAKQQLSAAIVGLLFIIFSLVILEVIGVSILELPGWGN